MIFVENKRKSIKNLIIAHPNALIIDVTSKGEEPFIKFSPFYPHGNIPIPFSKNKFSMTVEGVWQGLKVFQDNDVDKSKFHIDNMQNIKRSERKFGKVIGHRKGINGKELLEYGVARKEIYLRTYGWLLDNLLHGLIEELKVIAYKQDLILLDYETNSDIENLNKPLSHAGLIKRYIEKKYPEIKSLEFSKLSNKNEIDKYAEKTSRKNKELNKTVRVPKKTNKKNIKKSNIQLPLDYD